MLKQGLQQKLQQSLSPLQIQKIKLLELTTLELEQRIQKELEENPILDEKESSNIDEGAKNISINDPSFEDNTPSYKLHVNNYSKDIKPQHSMFSAKESFHQSLLMQLGYTHLKGDDLMIAKFIIGSLDNDGYLRRDLSSITDDIAFRLNIETTDDECERILKVIQEFEPVGIGARNLRECLLLQLSHLAHSDSRSTAILILENYFPEFTKKHYDKISQRLGIDNEELRDAIDEIIHLNPRPGGQVDDSYTEQVQHVNPDFILEFRDGELILSLPNFSIPELRINRKYAQTLLEASNKQTREGRDAITFIKKKIESAKGFIDAVNQRYDTLYRTMSEIIEYQSEYFIDGDETKLKPMVLKNIAEATNLDISTISRVVNSKYIQTHFGIFPLKFFFSEGLKNESGEEVSTREIKVALSNIIGEENKSAPYTDEELVNLLSQKGYKVARRTIAKYREQLNIPIARLRKEI